ncbi:MAG TPA: DUF2497 domain-containing protein [Sphingomonas sp.]|nr:DUF2497 domain-containing protein [Sphingomonas sp.]
MEEILSSIKRIIAEESDVPVPRRAKAVPVEEPDVLELTDAVGEPETMHGAVPEPEPEFEEISVEEAPALAAAPVAPAPAAPSDMDALLSSATADASRRALASLSRMVVKTDEPAGDNTLEGLVRDMLRPMLKEWLDTNLPRIVQATVDREVARIAGRQG